MTSIQNTYNYYQPSYYNEEPKKQPQRYKKPSAESVEVGFWLASAVSALIMKALPSFSNPFLKQMSKEHSNNHLYKDFFIKSVKESGLVEKGVKLVHVTDPANDIGKGLNACYIPSNRQIHLNLDKASISGFHELGHAMNHLKGGFGKFMQLCRKPGYILAGLMGTIALFSKDKPKDSENRNVFDIVQDNCGKIAFAAMLPTVIEESMASYKGIKLAKQAGLSEKLTKNLTKFYGKALLSYGGYALLAGVSTFAASKIMDVFARPRKVD